VRPDWPLHTERLTLRPWEEPDFPVFSEMQGDVESARWLYEEARDEAASRRLFEIKKAGTELREEGQWMSCAVLAGEEVVGDVSFNWQSAEHRTGELGYFMHPRHAGHGYATEAARAILAWAFEDAGFHRVVGRIEPRNEASGRVLEKLGMRKEGHFVENEWIKGEWQSEAVYAILEREWQR
jgi:RimJ/RimL family protein N-acetyltransferase